MKKLLLIYLFLIGCGKEEIKYIENDPTSIDCTVVVHNKKKVITTIKCEDYTYPCK